MAEDKEWSPGIDGNVEQIGDKAFGLPGLMRVMHNHPQYHDDTQKMSGGVIIARRAGLRYDNAPGEEVNDQLAAIVEGLKRPGDPAGLIDITREDVVGEYSDFVRVRDLERVLPELEKSRTTAVQIKTNDLELLHTRFKELANELEPTAKGKAAQEYRKSGPLTR